MFSHYEVVREIMQHLGNALAVAFLAASIILPLFGCFLAIARAISSKGKGKPIKRMLIFALICFVLLVASALTMANYIVDDSLFVLALMFGVFFFAIIFPVIAIPIASIICIRSAKRKGKKIVWRILLSALSEVVLLAIPIAYFVFAFFETSLTH